MKHHLSNAAWGVLDYAAYPICLLVSAPSLLRHLGIEQYGVWIVCSAAINTGSIIASGFGDANIQQVAASRKLSSQSHIVNSVCNMMGINVTLGLAVMLIALAFVPMFAHSILSPASTLHKAVIISLVIAAVLMLVRAIESVCISTQRAFERYGKAIQISALVRIITVVLAIILAIHGHGISMIMAFTFVAITLGTFIQLCQLKRLIGGGSVAPHFDREAFSALFGFGVFSWLQAVSNILFSQADRLILGVYAGAITVTSYALCVQLAQPIYGITAAGLHFLFPYLAARDARSTDHRRTIMIAFSVNAAFTLAAGIGLYFTGEYLLRAWVGNAIALSANPILAPIVGSVVLLSLSVPAYYALLGLGKVRWVAAITVAGSLLMLLALFELRSHGVDGVAHARVSYGLVSLAMYLPLLRLLQSRAAQQRIVPDFNNAGGPA